MRNILTILTAVALLSSCGRSDPPADNSAPAPPNSVASSCDEQGAETNVPYSNVLCWYGSDVGGPHPLSELADLWHTTAVRGDFTRIVASGKGFCGVEAGGGLQCWDLVRAVSDEHPHLEEVVTVPLPNTPTGKFIDVSVGSDEVCAIRIDGSVECWSPWGDVVTLSENTPIGPFDRISIDDVFDGSMPSSKAGAACARRPSGELACWGRDFDEDCPGTVCPGIGAVSEFQVGISNGGSGILGIRANGRPFSGGSDPMTSGWLADSDNPPTEEDLERRYTEIVSNGSGTVCMQRADAPITDCLQKGGSGPIGSGESLAGGGSGLTSVRVPTHTIAIAPGVSIGADWGDGSGGKLLVAFGRRHRYIWDRGNDGRGHRSEDFDDCLPAEESGPKIRQLAAGSSALCVLVDWTEGFRGCGCPESGLSGCDWQTAGCCDWDGSTVALGEPNMSTDPACSSTPDLEPQNTTPNNAPNNATTNNTTTNNTNPNNPPGGCSGGDVHCDGSCRDATYFETTSNCGTCGVACNMGAGESCEDGSCGCPAGQTMCDGQCRFASYFETTSNCGTCGVACNTGAGESCEDGTCGCAAGQFACDGQCRDPSYLETARTSCGACGNVCGVSCSAASCLDVAEIQAREGHTCARLTDGTVRCWGLNRYGQLGDGGMSNGLNPVAVSGLSDVTQLAPGVQHTCAQLTDGTARCWGRNSEGQLGDGSTTTRVSPVAVSGLVGVVQLAASGAHTCARLTDGTVRCWGNNIQGQLGDGSTATSLTPVAVSGLAGVVQLVAGRVHTCARLTDGTVRCWGRNSEGQLGDGSTTQRVAPVAVSGLAGVTQLAAAGLHTCARLTDGTARCWGDNAAGQLGDGSTTQRVTPVAVIGLMGVTRITVGQAHTCAQLADGTARCWGANSKGQFGDGSTQSRVIPVAVSWLTGATQLAAGQYHTCARVTDGTVRCSGVNREGQLGDGSVTDRFFPTSVVW